MNNENNSIIRQGKPNRSSYYLLCKRIYIQTNISHYIFIYTHTHTHTYTRAHAHSRNEGYANNHNNISKNKINKEKKDNNLKPNISSNQHISCVCVFGV